MRLIKIWRSRKQILEGFLNRIFRHYDVEEIFEKRLGICLYCPEIDKKGSKCMVIGTQPCCGVCGCSLGLKLRSMSSSCPLESPRWEAVMTEEEENKLNINQ